MSRQKNRVVVILTVVVVAILGAVFLPCRSQELPLETLMADLTMLPTGWQVDRTLSYGREYANRADDNLMTVWKLEHGDSGSVATSFMMIQRYDHALLAVYWYTILTARDSLPHEVFRAADDWSYRSSFADQTLVVCTLPSAGTRCRVISRYCNYIVTLQFESPDGRNLEAGFQALWEEIDTHVGGLLVQKDLLW